MVVAKLTPKLRDIDFEHLRNNNNRFMRQQQFIFLYRKSKPEPTLARLEKRFERYAQEPPFGILSRTLGNISLSEYIIIMILIFLCSCAYRPEYQPHRPEDQPHRPEHQPQAWTYDSISRLLDIMLKHYILADESFDRELPPFIPWPPPKPSEFVVLPDLSFRHGKSNLTFGEAAGVILDSLLKAGYFERSFYGIPGGFALVMRLERINDDGSPMATDLRFAPPDEAKPFSISEYVRKLFLPLKDTIE